VKITGSSNAYFRRVINDIIAAETGISKPQVEQALSLLASGATIPFIARYRKEATGNLDEIQLLNIRETAERLEALEKRREYILEQARTLGKLNPELERSLREATDLNTLEDLYLPFKPRRKTKADAAREKGLEPLAALMYAQKDQHAPSRAASFTGNGAQTAEEALQGARDIMAEWISEDAVLRNKLRQQFKSRAIVYAHVKRGKKDKEESARFSDYFSFHESLAKCPAHRLHAMFRGENEGILNLKVLADENDTHLIIKRHCLRGYCDSTEQVKLAMQDAWDRLLQPSLESEFLEAARKKADEEAISVFALNARQLLLAPPLGEKRVLAIDPGFRTGCKVVCLSEQGDLLEYCTIYPHEPQREREKSLDVLHKLMAKHRIEAIAIGNGTAGRETLDLLQETPGIEAGIYMVSEAGASIYSASETAREEFPDLDLTIRGAISIGRRLQDPLAELVKTDPKNIGVGQYQHDVNQPLLKKRLDEVVESAVNSVGVNLNTASTHLLSYVSGIGRATAQAIASHRKSKGPFKSRKELLEVPRLGLKAFEQCAGFLRIRQGSNPLDNSAVHPERYPVVEKIARNLQVDISGLIGNTGLLQTVRLESYVDENIQLGLPTLRDIRKELEKPGLDPRGAATVVSFDAKIRQLADLDIGMELRGIVSNITDFGAFVDIGVKQDGLVHISQIADRFIKHPSEILKLGQQVMVRVLDVDLQRKRIQLGMKGVPQSN
jgi:protein Tex